MMINYKSKTNDELTINIFIVFIFGLFDENNKKKIILIDYKIIRSQIFYYIKKASIYNSTSRVIYSRDQKQADFSDKAFFQII